MSRTYLNDRWCVRCNRTDPSPYLAKNIDLFLPATGKLVLDLGCGNGRNTNFMKSKGFEVISVDMAGDFGWKAVLGVDPLPVVWVDIILVNYLMMFLNAEERNYLIEEIKRVASDRCIVMVELYAAKDSEATTKSECLRLQKDIFDKLGWDKVRYSQERFIARKPAFLQQGPNS